MIDPKTLRIGNILRWEDESNDLVRLTAIDDSEEITYVKYEETSRDESGGCLLEEFIPIPLTPEILEKCGFVRGETHDYALGDDYVYEDGLLGVITAIENQYGDWGVHYIDCKNLHTLQNLYFYLSEQELPINL